MHQLSAVSKAAGAYVVDVGQHQMWAAQSIEVQVDQRWLTSGGMGSMGFALPASIGTAVSLAPRPVVVIAGDGAFQCNLQELQTVVRNRLPIKIVVINNHCHGMVRQFQQSYFKEQYQSTLWGYNTPDFARVAEAFGIASGSVRNESEIDSGLRCLWDDPGAPALIEVTIDTFTNVYPKIAFRPTTYRDGTRCAANRHGEYLRLLTNFAMSNQFYSHAKTSGLDFKSESGEKREISRTASPTTLSRPTRVQGLLRLLWFGLLTLVGGIWAYYRIFTGFSFYDDEGSMMASVKQYLDGLKLYDQFWSGYGPVYYFYNWLLRTSTGTPVTHDVVRISSLLPWLATPLVCAWIVLRVTDSLVLATLAHLLTLYSLCFLLLNQGTRRSSAFCCWCALSRAVH